MQIDNTIYYVRINKFNSRDEGFDLLSNINKWAKVSKTVPYNAFKLYLFFAGFPESLRNSEFYDFTSEEIHDYLGISLLGSINIAFDQLMDAGYIHRFGQSKDNKTLWDFFIEPISVSKYNSYIDNYRSE